MIVSFDPANPDDGFYELNRTACVDECPDEEVEPHCWRLEAEHLCGRPLGVAVTPDGASLLIADAYLGILEMALRGARRGALSVVATHYIDTDGERRALKLSNSIQVGASGVLYFTHTTDNWERRTILFDLLETSPGGKLIRMRDWRRRRDETPRVVADGFTFPNGLVVDAGEAFALVAETAMSRVKRVELPSGSVSVALDNAPCNIDNLAWGVGADGVSRDQSTVWLGCAVRRRRPFALIDLLAPHPHVRRWIGGLLHLANASPVLYSLVPKTGMAIKAEARPGARVLRIRDEGVYMDATGADVSGNSTTPSPCTNWTRLVLPPVLSGHVSGNSMAVPFKGKLYMGSHKAEAGGLSVYSL